MTTNIILKNDPFIYDLASFIMSFAFSEVNSLLSIQNKKRTNNNDNNSNL